MVSTYCQRRKELIEKLEDTPGQVELTKLERQCLYSCDGFDYSCSKYFIDEKNLSHFPKLYKQRGASDIKDAPNEEHPS